MVQIEIEGIHFHCFPSITPVLDRDPDNGYMPIQGAATAFETGASAGEADDTARVLLNDKQAEQFPTAVVFSIERGGTLEHTVMAETKEELLSIHTAVYPVAVFDDA